MKRALICGVAGQDGSYLAKILLGKGYEVIGTSRDSMVTNFSNLSKLGIEAEVQTTSMAVNDFRSVLSTVKRYKPDEIYNVAGQTSVALSFEQPVEAMESISGGVLNILEVLRIIERPIRFYNAGSSECYGETSITGATEDTVFSPRSPYAVAKSSAYWLVKNYREAYNIYACTGILFNHESPLRPERFVTQKIVKSAARIAKNLQNGLELGNIDVYRDWGWAPDYVDAMWRMLQLDSPDDFIISTGHAHSLKEFVSCAFSYFNLTWEDHVTLNKNLKRPSEIHRSSGNPTKARNILKWEAKKQFKDLIESMCKSAISEI